MDNCIIKRLKEMRASRDISQEELAEVLSTSRVRISKIEHGIAHLTFDEVVLICNRYHVDI
jgi:transcriptional regulator with XRE-family HTH domain